MFYEDRPDDAFRFGDIVRGFVLSASKIDFTKLASAPKDYHIEVNQPDFAVILSPCCSIGNHALSLSPLIKVSANFFDNLYLKEDLARLNHPMSPQEAVPPAFWDKMSNEEKQQRLDLSHKKGIAFVEYFVYAPHDLLPEYKLKPKGQDGEIKTGFYMVDFRRLYRIVCRQVNSAKQSPTETKILQLSIQARSNLRENFVNYFNRVPPEDNIS